MKLQLKSNQGLRPENYDLPYACGMLLLILEECSKTVSSDHLKSSIQAGSYILSPHRLLDLIKHATAWVVSGLDQGCSTRLYYAIVKLISKGLH